MLGQPRTTHGWPPSRGTTKRLSKDGDLHACLKWIVELNDLHRSSSPGAMIDMAARYASLAAGLERGSSRVGADRRVHIRHSTGDVIHGKKQSKFNWDCTICRTCR